jgi:LruC domain-containing protein
VSYRTVIDLVTPLASSRFVSPYDPFIFRANRRAYEVHLPGRQPTPLADATLFGQNDDRTVPGTTATYMDATRRPWALDVPVDWKYPEETRDIGWAYPKIKDWAQSSGATARDWYTTWVSRHLYTKP